MCYDCLEQGVEMLKPVGDRWPFEEVRAVLAPNPRPSRRLRDQQAPIKLRSTVVQLDPADFQFRQNRVLQTRRLQPEDHLKERMPAWVAFGLNRFDYPI